MQPANQNPMSKVTFEIFSQQLSSHNNRICSWKGQVLIFACIREPRICSCTNNCIYWKWHPYKYVSEDQRLPLWFSLDFFQKRQDMEITPPNLPVHNLHRCKRLPSSRGTLTCIVPQRVQRNYKLVAHRHIGKILTSKIVVSFVHLKKKNGAWSE